MFERPPPSSGEIRALAHQLLQWADSMSARPAAMTEEDEHELILRLAAAMRGVSRLREGIFPDAGLGNACWDVLLDLFIRELNGYRTSLDQLVAADDIPAETVRRSLETLESLGLVTHVDDRSEKGVVWLALSERGKQDMFALLQETAALVRVRPAQTPT